MGRGDRGRRRRHLRRVGLPPLTPARRAAATAVVALGCLTLTATTAAAPTPPPVAPLTSARDVTREIAAGRLLFVGASYTVGWGATSPDRDYADLVAARLHRSFTVDAVAGTGFTNPGPRRQGTFDERIARLPARLDPRIVVLQGGRDDDAPAAEEAAAVRATVDLARARFEHAQVVVLGPIPATVPVSRTLQALNATIGFAAEAAGAGYVDPIAQDWITRRDELRYLGRIPGHPNDRGYADFATLLLQDLPAALRSAAPPEGPFSPAL